MRQRLHTGALVLIGCVLLVLTIGEAARIGGGGGGGSTISWPSFSALKEIVWANSRANAACIGGGTNPLCIYEDPTHGGTIRPKTDTNIRWNIWPDFTGCFYDFEGTSCILTIDPDAASPNAIYQFTAPYKPKVAFMVPLSPRGAATGAYESIVSNQPTEYYLTVTDANTDAADFSFYVTGRMAGASTATFRLIGVSKNAAPSGNIDLDCAVTSFTPGTDTFTAHSTTGEVTALLTPATQNRPVGVTTSAHTINGGALVAGDVVYGSCEVDATATTSAQMTDFRLSGWVLVTLDENSISD